MNRLLLDTGVLVDAERAPARLDLVIGDEDDVAIAAVTVAELLEGVHRAPPARRAAREAFVGAVLAAVPVEDYTCDTARAHARLLVHTRAESLPRGAHDLIVATTALATDRQLVTTDAKANFDTLPDVHARLLARS